MNNTINDDKNQDVETSLSLNGEVVIQPSFEVKRGTNAANALIEIVNKQKWYEVINGKKYLKVEAWQTLGRFYGLSARTHSVEFVEYPTGINGFKARVEVVNSEGIVVGAAESLCLRDESKWKERDTYALNSMAQTRATSKAFRQILSFVAVLAGYSPTPAEEMPVESISETKVMANNTDTVYATEEQLRELYKLARRAGVLKDGQPSSIYGNQLKETYKLFYVRYMTLEQYETERKCLLAMISKDRFV